MTAIMFAAFRLETFYFDELPRSIATLYFVTDSNVNGKGFDFTIRQIPNTCGATGKQRTAICDRKIAGQQDILTSPNFPDDYPNDVKCSFTIHKFNPEVCYVELQFLRFDVEESTDCTNDYLEIETTGEKLCGIKHSLTKVIPFPTDSEAIKLVFKSDRISNRIGFDIRVRQLPSSCYRPPGGARSCGSTSNVDSIFKSDNYPSAYNPNTDCYFYVRRNRPDVCRIQLYFTSFDVGKEFQGRCDTDFVEIQGVKYCGEKDGQTVIIDFAQDRNDVAVRFRTDGYDQREGFHIAIKQLLGSCSTSRNIIGDGAGGSSGCDQTFEEESFQIMSPGYQVGVYGPSQECRYTIKKSSFDVCALEVKYTTFLLQESDDCVKDYLEIDEQKICGKLPYDSVRTYQFASDEMVIKFHSDQSEEAAGFFLLVKQIKC